MISAIFSWLFWQLYFSWRNRSSWQAETLVRITAPKRPDRILCRRSLAAFLACLFFFIRAIIIFCLFTRISAVSAVSDSMLAFIASAGVSASALISVSGEAVSVICASSVCCVSSVLVLFCTGLFCTDISCAGLGYIFWLTFDFCIIF